MFAGIRVLCSYHGDLALHEHNTHAVQHKSTDQAGAGARAATI